MFQALSNVQILPKPSFVVDMFNFESNYLLVGFAETEKWHKNERTADKKIFSGMLGGNKMQY